MNRKVYLDHNASTPVHPEVVQAMLPYFSEHFGNPSSVHGFGREAREGLETAREQVAHFLRVGKEEIVFTSGGTESDNMAIKGVAGLYIRKGTKMVSVQHGGEHERRRRAGTENVPGIVGLGRAVEIRGRDMADEAVRLTAVRDRLWEGIRGRVPDVRLNGHPTRRLPGTCNVCFRDVESESIVLGLDLKGVGVSAGSACTSGNVEPSYVLVAMGVPVEWSMGAVRHSLGRSTTAEDIDYVVESTVPLVAKLRSVMPVRA